MNALEAFRLGEKEAVLQDEQAWPATIARWITTGQIKVLAPSATLQVCYQYSSQSSLFQ